MSLGLSIVQRLGTLLCHHVRVRSQPGKGSVFSIEVPLLSGNPGEVLSFARPAASGVETRNTTLNNPHRAGIILVVEDDPEVRELLALILSDDGHLAAAVADGPGGTRPDRFGSTGPGSHGLQPAQRYGRIAGDIEIARGIGTHAACHFSDGRRLYRNGSRYCCGAMPSTSKAGQTGGTNAGCLGTSADLFRS